MCSVGWVDSDSAFSGAAFAACYAFSAGVGLRLSSRLAALREPLYLFFGYEASFRRDFFFGMIVKWLMVFVWLVYSLCGIGLIVLFGFGLDGTVWGVGHFGFGCGFAWCLALGWYCLVHGGWDNTDVFQRFRG